MIIIFFNSLTLLSMFTIIILFVFFILTDKGYKTGNIIFALILLLFGFQIIYSYTTSNFMYQYFMKLHKLLYLLRQSAFLIGPSVYFYLDSILNKNKMMRKINFIHVLPFLFSLVFLNIYYINNENFIIWKSPVDLYDTIILLIQNIAYIIPSIILIVSSIKKTVVPFNNIRNSSGINWLRFLMLGFIVIWLVNLNSFATYMIVQKPSWCAYTASIFALTVFLFMSSTMFLLLLKPEIYQIIEKYKNNHLDDISKSEYLKKLNDYMEIKKPYLDPDITLEEISKDISINPRIISQIVNELSDNNVKSYINAFRIKESMKLLSDVKNNRKTILEILYESGFNSKSVFNEQFKKYSGLTPQEFRIKNS